MIISAISKLIIRLSSRQIN